MLTVQEIYWLFMSYADSSWAILAVHELCGLFMSYADCSEAIRTVHELCWLFMSYADCSELYELFRSYTDSSGAMLTIHELCWLFRSYSDSSGAMLTIFIYTCMLTIQELRGTTRRSYADLSGSMPTLQDLSLLWLWFTFVYQRAQFSVFDIAFLYCVVVFVIEFFKFFFIFTKPMKLGSVYKLCTTIGTRFTIEWQFYQTNVLFSYVYRYICIMTQRPWMTSCCVDHDREK